jgi:ABC-type multidrug transport system fused ATPase/permease subunit
LFFATFPSIQQAHTDEQITTALRRVRLVDKITGIGGVDANVATGGANFSQGEKQLMCFARALLSGAKLLVMDEATASVDMETDEKIQRMLRHELADVTVMTIAHRVHTITDSDFILVLEDGKVAEFGPPQELLANDAGGKPSLFKALYDESAKAEEEEEKEEKAEKTKGSPMSTMSKSKKSSKSAISKTKA